MGSLTTRQPLDIPSRPTATPRGHMLGVVGLACGRGPPPRMWEQGLKKAATVLHWAIDLLEVIRGGGGLNVVSAAARELHPWR
jgi:hypothetical protein